MDCRTVFTMTWNQRPASLNKHPRGSISRTSVIPLQPERDLLLVDASRIYLGTPPYKCPIYIELVGERYRNLSGGSPPTVKPDNQRDA